MRSTQLHQFIPSDDIAGTSTDQSEYQRVVVRSGPLGYRLLWTIGEVSRRSTRTGSPQGSMPSGGFS